VVDIAHSYCATGLVLRLGAGSVFSDIENARSSIWRGSIASDVEL